MTLLAKVVALVADDKAGHTSLVEWHHGKTEVPEDKPVPVALSITSHTDKPRIEPGPLTTEDGLTHATVTISLHRPKETSDDIM
jgi:hypothetical protein